MGSNRKIENGRGTILPDNIFEVIRIFRFGCCFHSFKVISLTLHSSDHIQLYFYGSEQRRANFNSPEFNLWFYAFFLLHLLDEKYFLIIFCNILRYCAQEAYTFKFIKNIILLT
jgi:hypothetical protein